MIKEIIFDEKQEKCKLILGFSVNPSVQINVAAANGWIALEEFERPFSEIKAYFVNGTLFSRMDGDFEIINGPTEFTWTFKESSLLCGDCKAKEEASPEKE